MNRTQSLAFLGILLAGVVVLPAQVNIPPATAESYITCTPSNRLTGEFVATDGPGVDFECDSGQLTLELTGGTTSIDIRRNGTLIGTRPGLNIQEGTNMSIVCTDDAGNDRVNCVFTASGTSAGGAFTEIPCTGNITSAFLIAANAGEAIQFGRGTCSVTSPFVLSNNGESVYQWQGTGIGSMTILQFSAPAAGRCGIERLPAVGSDEDGFSQSRVENIRFEMSGSARDMLCINGLSNGTVFRNVDIRGGKFQWNIGPADSDNSVCFLCQFDNIFGGFGLSDAMFRFDGNNTSIMMAVFTQLDIHSNVGGSSMPLIEVDGMRDEESWMTFNGILMDGNGATQPAMDFTNVGDFPISIVGGHLTDAPSIVRANSNLAVNMEAFNARRNPTTPTISCTNAVDYVAPASHADIPCSGSPGMAAGLGRPVIKNGRSMTIP